MESENERFIGLERRVVRVEDIVELSWLGGGELERGVSSYCTLML